MGLPSEGGKKNIRRRWKQGQAIKENDKNIVWTCRYAKVLVVKLARDVKGDK